MGPPYGKGYTQKNNQFLHCILLNLLSCDVDFYEYHLNWTTHIAKMWILCQWGCIGAAENKVNAMWQQIKCIKVTQITAYLEPGIGNFIAKSQVRTVQDRIWVMILSLLNRYWRLVLSPSALLLSIHQCHLGVLYCFHPIFHGAFSAICLVFLQFLNNSARSPRFWNMHCPVRCL